VRNDFKEVKTCQHDQDHSVDDPGILLLNTPTYAIPPTNISMFT
jgi:hypothetical protein